jgi:FixJ family two-component response regulator
MDQNQIFLVEDDADLRGSYIHLLKSLGNVVTFANAAEFLKHLKDHPGQRPDLVITDLSMPKMTGVEMVAAAAALGVRFPVILISGMVTKDSAIQAMNSGFCMILEKPVKSSHL